MSYTYSRSEMFTLQQKIETVVKSTGGRYFFRNDGHNWYIKSAKSGKEISINPDEALTGEEGKRPWLLRDDLIEILKTKFKQG